MKRIFLAVFILMMILPAFFYVKAEEKTDVSKVVVNEEKRKLELENIREEIKLKMKEKLTQKKKENIQKYFTQMVERMQRVLEVQGKIALKIESRLKKMKEKGIEVADLENKLIIAKTKQTAINNKLNEIKTQENILLEADDPKSIFKEVKLLVKELSIQVKEVHQLYVEIVSSMKGLSN